MQRQCMACGSPFETRSKAAKYCSDRCRKRVNRAGIVNLGVAAPAQDEQPRTSMVAQTLTDLEKAGAMGTSAGVAALILAERIDSRQDTGSSLAAVTREHQTIMQAILGASTVKATPMDELRALRERRRTG